MTVYNELGSTSKTRLQDFFQLNVSKFAASQLKDSNLSEDKGGRSTLINLQSLILQILKGCELISVFLFLFLFSKSY